MRKRKDLFLESLNFIIENATLAQLNLLELAVSHGKELREKERTESGT